MIIRYETSTGNILGYTKVGGSIPETPEENNSYLRWNGITPEPPKDYKVLNGQVVEKSDEEKQELIDAQLKRAEEGRKAASQTIIREEVGLTEVLERLSELESRPQVIETEEGEPLTVVETVVEKETIREVPAEVDLSHIEARLDELERVPEVVEEEVVLPTLEELNRTLRDEKLQETDWLITRHREEREFGIKTTLTAVEYSLLLRYRNLLRKVPQQAGFPEDVDWPDMPV